MIILACVIWLAVIPAQAAATTGHLTASGQAGQAWADIIWQDPPAGEWPDLTEIQAKAWIVYDRLTGETILAHQADQVLYPASTTKIMTAILTLENLRPDLQVTASETAVKMPSGSSKIGLKAGETLLIRDLLAGLMIASGNDAANVLAETMDGSLEQFALRMNAKAEALGMTQTHFCNPSGLHDDAHVTSARDLVILADYAMSNRQFRELASLSTYVMPATNMHPFLGWALLVNSNRLTRFDESSLGSTAVRRYSGIKTGTTPYAGSCLVGSAELIDGRELISVVLGVPSSFADGSSFSITHVLIEEAARIVLDGTPVVTEPAGSTEITTETTQSGSSSPTPVPATQITQPTDPPAVLPTDPDLSRENSLSAFLRDNPWRTAFIMLAILLLVFYLWCLFQARRRERRRVSKATIRPRRVRPGQ